MLHERVSLQVWRVHVDRDPWDRLLVVLHHNLCCARGLEDVARRLEGCLVHEGSTGRRQQGKVFCAPYNAVHVLIRVFVDLGDSAGVTKPKVYRVWLVAKRFFGDAQCWRNVLQ